MKIHDSLKTVNTTSKVAAMIFFGALIVAAFYTGIWYERNRLSLDTQPAVSLEPSMTPTPTAMPVSAATKTYTDSTYKYSFEYPDNLTAIQPKEYISSKLIPGAVYVGTKVQTDGASAPIDSFDLGVKGSVRIDAGKTQFTEPTAQDHWLDGTYTVSSKNITVDGIQAKEFTLIQTAQSVVGAGLPTGGQEKIIQLSKNGTFAQIRYYDVNNDYTSANIIINSFKFN